MLNSKTFLTPVLLVLLIMGGCEPTATPDSLSIKLTTLVLVRHAEKANTTDNSPLTDRGYHRAETLASWLQDAQELSAVYSTPYRRTQETVTPTAVNHHLEVQAYQPDQDVADFLSDVLDQHAGKCVLICGHSNTIPSMLNHLVGEDRYENLSDDEYNHVYIVTATGLGNANIVDLHMDLAEYLPDTIDVN